MAGWVKVETRFPSHPKVLDIGPMGEALWLRGLCYAGDQLTDGFVPTSFIKRMGDMKGLTVAARLVDAGLWDEAEDGFVIHDYLDWQRSRDDAAEVSSKRAEAGRRGGKQRASNLLETCLANGKQTGSKTQADKNREDKEESANALNSAKPNGYSADFEIFWTAYPSGHGVKKPSFAQWQRLAPADRQAAMVGLDRWKSCERWQDGFIKPADIWLRDRWFENEPPPPKRTNITPLNRAGHSGKPDSDQMRQWANELNQELGQQ